MTKKRTTYGDEEWCYKMMYIDNRQFNRVLKVSKIQVTNYKGLNKITHESSGYQKVQDRNGASHGVKKTNDNEEEKMQQ